MSNNTTYKLKNTAVLFLVFNRPDVTERVFEAIRQAKPPRLYISSDGPRENRKEERKVVEKTRRIATNVDWDCEVKTLFRDENLGCRMAVSGGIDWFFEHEEMGIILEDDCLPDNSFFPFCEELLERYRNDTRIGMISGNNWGFKQTFPLQNYSFSKHGLIWGWATWKRAWHLYSTVEMMLDNEEELEVLIKKNISNNKIFVKTWWKGVKLMQQKKISTWAYQWGVARYAHNLLTIRPNVNLVANIGFGINATHTRHGRSVFSATQYLLFPLQHPTYYLPDYKMDKALEKFFLPENILRRIYKKLKILIYENQ